MRCNDEYVYAQIQPGIGNERFDIKVKLYISASSTLDRCWTAYMKYSWLSLSQTLITQTTA